jgi:hypothetical protein
VTSFYKISQTSTEQRDIKAADSTVLDTGNRASSADVLGKLALAEVRTPAL